MAEQFSTKTNRQLKEACQAIAKNLSPLIGCRVGEIGWSPYVADKVCSAFTISRTNVIDSSMLIVPNEIGGYVTYNPVVTQGASDVWRGVKAFDPKYLNPYYIMLVGAQIPVNISIQEQLALASKLSLYTDSTIFDCTFDNEQVTSTDAYKVICHILLDCFTIRYFLMAYTDSLNLVEVRAKVLDRIIESVDFVKQVLDDNFWVTINLRKSLWYVMKQLNFLRKNLLMVESNILRYIRD